jgi:hypothetical protein
MLAHINTNGLASAITSTGRSQLDMMPGNAISGIAKNVHEMLAAVQKNRTATVSAGVVSQGAFTILSTFD